MSSCWSEPEHSLAYSVELTPSILTAQVFLAKQKGILAASGPASFVVNVLIANTFSLLCLQNISFLDIMESNSLLNFPSWEAKGSNATGWQPTWPLLNMLLCCILALWCSIWFKPITAFPSYVTTWRHNAMETSTSSWTLVILQRCPAGIDEHKPWPSRGLEQP